jgi:Big-like domain-containing protein
MFHSASQRVVPIVAPAAARLTSVYQTAAHDVLLPLIGEISPPPKPHARSFRDRVHSPLGRFIARFLARWLVIAPLPQPVQQLALVWPVSILAPFVNEKRAETPTTEEQACAPASGSIGTRLSECANPTRHQTLPSVGGKLAFALGEGNSSILFGSAYSKFGAADPSGLNGVRAAALGQVAIIESINPKRVVVDKDKKAAEGFDVKYRVIPSDEESTPAYLQLGSGETTYQQQAVTLTNGRGTSTLAVGTDLSRSAPYIRIVANPGADNELIGFRKVIPTAEVRVGPPEFVELSADARRMTVVAYSDSHLERSLDARAAGQEEKPVSLTWEVVGSGATLSNAVTVSTTGVFETELTASAQAGSSYRVQARLPGSGVLGISEPISVVPGEAHTVGLSVPKNALPADGASEVTINLTARDQNNNVVADGTTVSWIVNGGGVIEPATTTTVAGAATVTYRAGRAPGTATLVADVGDAEATTNISLAPIQITVAPAASTVAADSKGLPVSITATSSAGPPSDQAQLVLHSTLGRLDGPSSLSNGQTTGTFVPLGVTREAKLWAFVGESRGEGSVLVQPPTSGFFLSSDQSSVVGNRTEDGVADFISKDGTPKSVPYATWATLTATGTPGQTMELQLGDVFEPNVEPIAWYAMDDLSEGKVVDEYHDHEAAVTIPGVSLDLGSKTTGAGSLRFDGQSQVEVPDHTALTLANDVGFTIDFNAGTPQEATLLSKSGAYGASLVPDGFGVRVKAFVIVDGVEHSALSDVVDLGTWHTASIGFEGGVLALDVDRKQTRTNVAGVIETRAGPVVIGSGFIGNLDNVRLFDLSRPKLAAFEDGSFRTSLLIGPDGRASVRVRSLGNLRNHSPNEKREAVKYWIRDQLEPLVKWNFMWRVSLEMHLEIADGFITGEVDTPLAFIADVVASFVIYGDARDGLINGLKVGEGTATKIDMFVLVMSVIGLLSTLTVVGDLIVGAMKDGGKVLGKIAPTLVRKRFGLIYLEALHAFLKGKAGPLMELVEFLKVFKDPAAVVDFYRVCEGFTNFDRVRAIIRLGARTGEGVRVIRGLAAAHAAMDAALPAAKRLENVGHLVDLLSHHLDEAAKLGLTGIPALSDEAMVGAARMLEVVGDAGKAKETLTALMNGAKHTGWHANVANEFFGFLACLPKGTKGLDQFLVRTQGVTKVKGAYGVLRLLCQAPELSGKEIDTIFDLLENGKEGVDAVVLLPSNVAGFAEKIPEFWEFKHVANADRAVTDAQIQRHIQERVAAYYASLKRRGTLTPAQIQAAMSQVRLRFEVIAPSASAATKADILARAQAILNQKFPNLAREGFHFAANDVFVRQADPLVKQVSALPSAF